LTTHHGLEVLGHDAAGHDDAPRPARRSRPRRILEIVPLQQQTKGKPIMQAISGGSWFTIGDQCRLRATATGSDEGHLIFGEPPHQHELTFTATALRTFVTKGAAVLDQIEAMAAEEDTVVALDRTA
jgi:hypothetical protein